jgi:threonine dehydrogenase-like Zn-dependent dehydrogenase
VVPNDVESETAILVPEFARAVRAVLQHPPAKGDKVLVIGGGTLGLLTTYALRELVDHDECNLIVQHPFEGEMARHLGLGESILSIDPAETYEQVADVVDGAVRYPEFGRICLEGGADLVFETTGERDHCEDAFRLAGEGKRVILASARQTSGFDLSPLWLKNTAVAGSLFSGAETYNGAMTTSFDIALDLVARRDSPLRSLVTHTFRLDDFRQAMEAVADRSASRALKAIFHHVV